MMRDLVFILLAAFAVPAASQTLQGEFWIRTDLLPPGVQTEDHNGREREAINTLLEDARWVFSGMIYGFEVHWTPPNRARNIVESFQLKPLALIPRGDSRLRVLSTVRENGFSYITLSYEPDAVQKARLAGWAGNRYPMASGFGAVLLDAGYRRRAMEAGVKETLRQWLRAREYNRPLEVTGRVTFLEVPRLGLRGAYCTASVTLRLDLNPLLSYPVD